MTSFSAYETYDALGLAQLVRQGETTAMELLEAAIERVAARNPALNAVVMPMYDQARQSIADGLPDGPLKGVPFLLKDLGLFCKGVVTTFGSRLFADFVPDHDSTLVERYRRAGLVVFGKTNTPELGLTITTEPELYGPCRNPWHLDHSCGGSSGGAAAAVAAGMVPAAHASDGGGSIRIPAACCGLFGLKPTRGRIPVGPWLGENWNGFGIDHAITRTVRDSAALLDVSAGPAAGDPYSAPPVEGTFLSQVGLPPGRLRIAFTDKAYNGLSIDPQCVAAVHDAARLCEELGHTVSEAAPPIDFEAFQEATVAIINANAHTMLVDRATALGRELCETDVEHITWRAALAGSELTAADYIRAVQTIHRTGRRMARFFESYDVLLSPVLQKPPAPLGFLDTRSDDVRTYVMRMNSYFGFTGLFNATGQPSMSVPLSWSEAGLPIGLLFSARIGEEGLLLRLAAQLEQARPWQAHRPPLGNLTEVP